jgi:hypothetical protein
MHLQVILGREISEYAWMVTQCDRVICTAPLALQLLIIEECLVLSIVF